MHKRVKVSLVLVTLAFFSATIFFFFKTDSASTTEKKIVFLTIDERELDHIRSVSAAKGTTFNFQTRSVRGGLAVVEIEDSQLGMLSSYMHDEYHKCSGFMAHESLEAAEQSINETLTADANAKFVEYTIDNHANVNAMLALAEEPKIRQTIIDLSAFPNRRHNQPSGLESANWIKDKWTELAKNRSDMTVEAFNHASNITQQPSIILTIQGTTRPSEVIVLGGHQDSINTSSSTGLAPGADDDASGIACLTEAIRVIAESGFRPERTVKFMAYAAEEVGLRGSNDIATRYQQQNIDVKGVLQLDMTNYKGTSNVDISIFSDYTNFSQNLFLFSLISTYQPELSIGQSQCGYGCSDHYSWHNKGFPASFPHEANFQNSNPNIHKTDDTIAQSQNNANHALKFAKLALSYVGELAKGTIQNSVPNRTRFDYDGDGKSDISVFRPENMVWYVNNSTSGFFAMQFGFATDEMTPADFDGDGRTDIAVYRDGVWHLMRSELGYTAMQFGLAGDIPQPADFDGDGKADVAVFRPSNNVWYVMRSSEGFFAAEFGMAGDRPIANDYDGDGKADMAVFRQGEWHIMKSGSGYFATQFGLPGDVPVPADFDGDGSVDMAVFRDGVWYVQRSTEGFLGIQFGLAGDVPVPADYNGDGRADIGIFREGVWYQMRSPDGGLYIEQFGLAADIPTQSAY